MLSILLTLRYSAVIVFSHGAEPTFKVLLHNAVYRVLDTLEEVYVWVFCVEPQKRIYPYRLSGVFHHFIIFIIYFRILLYIYTKILLARFVIVLCLNITEIAVKNISKCEGWLKTSCISSNSWPLFHLGDRILLFLCIWARRWADENSCFCF